MQKRKYIAEVNLKVIKEFLLNYYESNKGLPAGEFKKYNTQARFYRAIEVIKFPFISSPLDYTFEYQVISKWRRSVSPENTSRNVYAPNNYFPIVDFLFIRGLFGYRTNTGSRTIQYFPSEVLKQAINSLDTKQFTSWIEKMLDEERAKRKESKNKIKTDMKETVTLSKDFVLEAHKHACPEWKEMIEKQAPELFETIYNVGDKFCYRMDENDMYMLVRVDRNAIALISLNDGNRWVKYINVADSNRITKEEFKQVTGCQPDFFTKIVK